MWLRDGATSCLSVDVTPSLYTEIFVFQDKERREVKSRIICQAFAMPRKGLKKTLDEAQAQAEAGGQFLFMLTYFRTPSAIFLCISLYHFFLYFRT